MEGLCASEDGPSTPPALLEVVFTGLLAATPGLFAAPAYADVEEIGMPLPEVAADEGTGTEINDTEQKAVEIALDESVDVGLGPADAAEMWSKFTALGGTDPYSQPQAEPVVVDAVVE